MRCLARNPRRKATTARAEARAKGRDGGRGKGQGGRGKGKGKRPALQKSGKGKGKQRAGKRGGAAATDNPVTPARKRSVVDDEALSGPKTDNKEKKLRPPTEDVQVAPETNPGEAEHETPKKVAPKASQQPRKPAAKAKASAKAKAAKTKAQATKAKKAKAKAKAKASRSKPLQSNSKPKQGAAATSKVKEDKLPKDKSEGKAQKEKSFARRWRPGAAKAGNHWQALRDVLMFTCGRTLRRQALWRTHLYTCLFIPAAVDSVRTQFQHVTLRCSLFPEDAWWKFSKPSLKEESEIEKLMEIARQQVPKFREFLGHPTVEG